MKSIFITVAFLVAAVSAGPVASSKIQQQVFSSGLAAAGNATLPASEQNATISHQNRTKRDCGLADLDKIEAKITESLIKQIEQLLGAHAQEGGNKTRRSTSEAAAASKVDPDGTIKTVAAAKGSNDPEVPVPEPLLTNGHQLPPVDPSKKLSPDEELPPPPPLQPEEPVPTTPLPAHHEGGAGGAPSPHPVAGTGNTVQKVVSSANMEKGTAVASAIAKRAAVLQTVDTSGGKAIANAEAHKGADTNVQSVSANGTHVGIASAIVDNRNASANTNHSGPELVLQNVAASGSKAVATATNNKGSGSSVQDLISTGDEISVASAVSARAKRETFYVYRQRTEIPETPAAVEDDGSYKPDDDSDDDQEVIVRRVTRSPCISTKMDENLRKLIQESVASAFADLKKE